MGLNGLDVRPIRGFLLLFMIELLMDNNLIYLFISLEIFGLVRNLLR